MQDQNIGINFSKDILEDDKGTKLTGQKDQT